ncbi:MAG: hypothetical protein J6M34_06840 [Clostridia bacterium]|nr:hypothetical protein [Clostridia bacterium]
MYTTSVPIIIDTPFEKEALLKDLQRCKVNRVAFALNRETEHTFTSPANLERLKEMLEFFKEKGFETAVWIGETLGHDQVTQFPEGCEEPYRHMKLPRKGTVASFCPTDEKFVADLCKWMTAVAELKPDLIMLDDDYRINGGCICPAHVAWINRELGEDLTGEEIFRRAFTGGPNRYRDIWLKVQGETLYELARALRDAVDKVNPQQRMGLCCASTLWDEDGTDPERLVRILAGSTKPFLRTWGAPYHSFRSTSKQLGASLELERWEFSHCKNWNIEFVSEGDTYPRPRFYCSASYLECFDQILRADGQACGILKYSADYASPTDYETGYCDAWERNLPLYKQIDEIFRDKTAVGVLPYVARNLLATADLGKEVTEEGLKVGLFTGGTYNATSEFALWNNLPTAYEGTGARILFGENARHIPLEDLQYGCILDYPAAKILQQRGVDVGIREKTENIPFPTTYLGGAVQRYIEENCPVRVSGAALPEQLSFDPKAEVLSEFVSGEYKLPGWTRYENEAGPRFLIFPFDAKRLQGKDMKYAGYLNGYALRRMLTKQAEWLNRKPLDAYAEGNHPTLYTLVKKGEDSLAVGLWNLFEDKIHDLTVKINGDYKSIRFINCEGKLEGDRVTLSSVLYPYEFAGFELY